MAVTRPIGNTRSAGWQELDRMREVESLALLLLLIRRAGDQRGRADTGRFTATALRHGAGLLAVTAAVAAVIALYVVTVLSIVAPI